MLARASEPLNDSQPSLGCLTKGSYHRPCTLKVVGQTAGIEPARATVLGKCERNSSKNEFSIHLIYFFIMTWSIVQDYMYKSDPPSPSLP